METRFVREHASVLAFDFNGKRYLLEASDSVENRADLDRFQQEVFWEIFGRLANTYAPARTIIWLLLGGVGVLVAGTILQSIWSVLVIMFPNAWHYWQ